MFDDLPKVTPLSGVCRENAARKLAKEACPLCREVGKFSLFNSAMHVGVRCDACGREHVFRSRGLMWVPSIEAAWKRGKL